MNSGKMLMEIISHSAKLAKENEVMHRKLRFMEEILSRAEFTEMELIIIQGQYKSIVPEEELKEYGL